jgi:hypothetical protein
LQALKSKTLNFSAGIYLMNSEYSFIYTLLYAENSPVWLMQLSSTIAVLIFWHLLQL